MSSPALPPRWTRPAQFLVYLVPVGGIPLDLFASYVRLLQTHNELPLRSLTRPGGYAAELSPFRGLDWSGAGSLRFYFVSTAERIDSCDGEDVHACNRVIGALGVCHSPSLTLSGGLRAAHAQFEALVQSFRGLLMHKLFAFEHTFEDATASECEGLSDLVMFPVHHELEGTGESTVSLHLQVVMGTLAVNILMALESAIRSATSSAVANGVTMGGDLASVLLDVNVEPHASEQVAASPLVLSRDLKSDALFNSFLTASPTSRSLLSSGSSFASIPSSLTLDPRSRRLKRQLARREKLLGDYSVLVSCVSAAVDHYSVAIDMLRDEERRSGGAAGDALWLAAALEGAVFCLYNETPDKLSPELVEKASDAITFYAKAGTSELESLLIENMGQYYANVAMTTLTRTPVAGAATLRESVWFKRLLWDVLERGSMLLPELQTQRQIEFYIQTSGILDAVGHGRRVAFFLHEAATILLARNAPRVDAQSNLMLSPSKVTKEPQRRRDLEAALLLERMAANHLGIQGLDAHRNELLWEARTVFQKYGRKNASQTSRRHHPWLIIRFHVLRQLLTIARMLGDALLVGTYCLQLLEMLIWCDSIAQPGLVKKVSSTEASSLLVDHLQQTAISLRGPLPSAERATFGLHTKSGVYFSPPPGTDTKVRRSFITSPSATMSNAAASLSSTLTNTPRLLATPRHQLSAAVNALSTKASPAFSPFAHAHFQLNGLKSSRASDVEDPVSTPKSMNSLNAREFDADGDSGSKRSQSLFGEGEKVNNTDVTEPLSVWNLHSKAEIAKIERKVINILESDCRMLRSNNQIQLPTFLRVEKLQLLSSCDLQHPFYSKKTAHVLFGAQSSCQQQAVKSDFLFSPFERKKPKQKSSWHKSRSEDNESDDASAMYEKAFLIYERLKLQLRISNPMGVAIKLQEVKAWVTSGCDGSLNSERAGGIECYPCYFTLEVYQKFKTVVLEIQPLRVGTFYIRGCFIKVLNIKTSFQLEDPVSIQVVGELPMVALCLHDHHSTVVLDGKKAAMTQEPGSGMVQLAMFSSETRQFVFRVRSFGNCQITNYRLAVSLQHRRTLKKTRVLFNNLALSRSSTNDAMQELSTTTNGFADKEQIETETLALRCSNLLSSPLPFTSGDCISVPFELTLREKHDQLEPSDDIEIEWSVVYADETSSKTNEVFYRETKLTVQLVSTPALKLHSVTLLPCGLVPISVKGRVPQHHPIDGFKPTTDHVNCGIVIHVINPLETTFQFRLRSHFNSSEQVICEAEIGRQCSRQFIVEVPRLKDLVWDSGVSSLIDALNRLLTMEWETYFGTRGCLFFEKHNVVPIRGLEQFKRELYLPPVKFTIQPSLKESTPVEAHEGRNGYVATPKFGGERSLSLQPLTFFQTPRFHDKFRMFQVQLFEYVSIAIAIEPTVHSNDTFVAELKVEVIITEEDEDTCLEMSDNVMVVGLLQTHVQWTKPMNLSPKMHEIQCMFLSEGTFCVKVCGQVLDEAGKQVKDEIWCHQPLHVRVRSEDAAASII